MTQPVLLITGATSPIGDFLCRRLEGHPIVAVSRTPSRSSRETVRWLIADIGQAPRLPQASTLIHLAPLALLPALLPEFLAQGGRRVIAFGTTSRYSKSASSNAEERAFAEGLVAAEQEVAALCESAGAAWTLFRPTLIYGAGRDRNVALIGNIIRRFGVFPLLGEAAGLRQPVHADDLAAACVAALDAPASFNKAYDLCGSETLTYRDMVSRIFLAMGKQPRFVKVPMWIFRTVMWAMSRWPRYHDFNAEMARRMNQDLAFDCTAAREDFGFAPRGFEPRMQGCD